MSMYETPPVRCPGCNAKLEAASNAVGEGAPGPGDFTLCVECGACLRFDRGLALRLATPAEVHTLPAETKAVLAAVSHVVLLRIARAGLN